MNKTEALVTPQLIQWARQRYYPNLVLAAKKLSVTPDKLSSWERGDERPTFRQAQSLAQKFHIPFGYLFLPDPPVEQLPLPDFRSVPTAQKRSPSPEFIELLNDVLRKQEWFREYQENEGARPVPFIGRFTSHADPEKVAKDIRETLGINDEMRQSTENWEQFLRNFIHKSEAAGVLVLRSGIVKNDVRRTLNVQEFRGFAISDKLAPAVFINGQDAKAAQIFTLAHELAHLWVGQSAISNPDYTRRSSQQDPIDRFCDQVAAETLLPKQDFLFYWKDHKSLVENLGALAVQYRVSQFVVLRRAYDNDKLTDVEYQRLYRELLATPRPQGKKDGGGDFYRVLLARNSNTFTMTLLAAAAEGRVSRMDTARLLNVKVGTVRSVQNKLLLGGLPNA